MDLSALKNLDHQVEIGLDYTDVFGDKLLTGNINVMSFLHLVKGLTTSRGRSAKRLRRIFPRGSFFGPIISLHLIRDFVMVLLPLGVGCCTIDQTL